MTNIFLVAQERPCARCIKRNIGHLCHDEPREPEPATKKSKSQHTKSEAEDDGTPPDQAHTDVDGGMNNSFEQERSQETSLTLGTTSLSQAGPLQIVQPSPVSGIQSNALNSNSNQCKLPSQLILLATY
jgi:hypothetical protein